jgi:hypothetical protein
MSVEIKGIAIKSIEDLAPVLKEYAEPHIIKGEKFPARLDVWFQENLLASIIFPVTTPETFETVISRTIWACSTLGGTHIVFTHRAEIAISSTLSQEVLDETSTPCLCFYLSSFINIHSAVYPYTYAEGDAIVEWSENSSDNSPINDSEMLQNYLFQASQINTTLADATSYVEWLRFNGYEVIFHEPYTETNFAYDGIH